MYKGTSDSFRYVRESPKGKWCIVMVFMLLEPEWDSTFDTQTLHPRKRILSSNVRNLSCHQGLPLPRIIYFPWSIIHEKKRKKEAPFKCLLQFSGESSYFLILGLSARGQISLSGSINTSRGSLAVPVGGGEASLSDLENPHGCFRGHVTSANKLRGATSLFLEGHFHNITASECLKKSQEKCWIWNRWSLITRVRFIPSAKIYNSIELLESSKWLLPGLTRHYLWEIYVHTPTCVWSIHTHVLVASLPHPPLVPSVPVNSFFSASILHTCAWLYVSV